jgi:hypothetical protein
LLAGVCGVGWILSLLPAYLLFGMDGMIATTVSSLSCLAAGAATFYLVGLFVQTRMQAYGVLAGTLVRSVFALVAAIVMQFCFGLAPDNYFVWLGLFYLLALALETVVLMHVPKSGTSS